METNTKEECALCLGSMVPGQGQALFTAECCHTYHFSCIASCVQHGYHNCPICHATWTDIPSLLNPQPTSATSVTCQALGAINLDPTSFADDEPLTETPNTNTNTNSSPIPPHPHNANMIVTALPQYPAFTNSDQSNSFAVLIGIQAPCLSSEIEHAPLDLVAVLDVSGSMGGEKTELVKQAIDFVVDSMGPSDRLSIITFASTAERVTPLMRMTDAGRADTKLAVQYIKAYGSTNITAGMKTAVEVLDQRREKNPVSSILLLSDGIEQCERTSSAVSQTDAVPVHTFGIGPDHDATALHTIADRLGGTFSYIESIDTIQDAFAQCIGGLLSVTAQEVKVQMRCVSPGVQFQSIPSGRYRNSIDAGKVHGVIYMVDVYAEEKKLFLVYLSVPPADQETSATQLLEVRCCYNDPLSNQYIMSDIVGVEIRRPSAEGLSVEDMQVCLEVDREINRISISEGIVRAQAMAERRELSEAVSLLEHLKIKMMLTASGQANDALCEQLEKELKAMQERMRSRVEYEARGRGLMLSRIMSHRYQRASTQALMPPSSSGSSVPPEIIPYQTAVMRRMVQKSQEMRQLRDRKNEDAAESSNTRKP